MPPPKFALHTLNILIGCISIVIIGLTTHSIVLKDGLETQIPKSARATGMGLLMWAGVGGVVDTILFLVLLLFKRRSAGKAITTFEVRLQYATLFVATFILCRPLVITTYAFVEHDREETPESWACSARLGGDRDALCKELRAARYLLIPLLVLCAALCAGTWWAWAGMKKTNTPPEQVAPIVKEGGESV